MSRVIWPKGMEMPKPVVDILRAEGCLIDLFCDITDIQFFVSIGNIKNGPFSGHLQASAKRIDYCYALEGSILSWLVDHVKVTEVIVTAHKVVEDVYENLLLERLKYVSPQDMALIVPHLDDDFKKDHLLLTWILRPEVSVPEDAI